MRFNARRDTPEAHVRRNAATGWRDDVQREMGYINQATPTLMTTNSANDHSVYLIQFDAVRCVRHASAMETNRANESKMPK